MTAEHRNARTVAALEMMMNDMKYLVDHPRMQQRRWVAKGKEWLPILQHAKEDLQHEAAQYETMVESFQGVLLALERVGLSVEMRDESSWGYRWHKGTLTGAFLTRGEAIEAGLRERLV